MHTEHLQNVSPLWVFLGWLVSIAVTSVIVVVLTVVGLMTPEGTPVGWAVAAVALGFWAGGYMTGTRDIDAPILHGVGIGLTTLVAWFVLNLLVALFSAGSLWAGLAPTATAGILLLQMAAALAGAWAADRRALGGGDLAGGELGDEP